MKRGNCDRPVIMGMRFALWAQGLRRLPSVEQIVDHFDCSIATAYRYLNFYCDASGQVRQPLAISPARWQARKAHLATYMSDRPCLRNHAGPRFTSTGRCVECTRGLTGFKDSQTPAVHGAAG